jgi:hypothetical protein
MALIRLIWRRLRRMNQRFAEIVAQFRAGTLPAVRSRLGEGGAQAGPEADSAPAEPAAARAASPARPQLPSQRSGWVIYAISWFVWNRHYELEEMLEDPEVVQLVVDAPQLGSVLRALCRMLAVKLPAWLRLPRKPRRRVVKTVPPAPEWLLAEPGAELRADGTVWMRLGASTKWRPGGPETLEEMQKFDRPVQIWPHRV